MVAVSEPVVGELLRDPSSGIDRQIGVFLDGLATNRLGDGAWSRPTLLHDIGERWSTQFDESPSIDVYDADAFALAARTWAQYEGYDDVDAPSRFFVIPVDPEEHPTGLSARQLAAPGKRSRRSLVPIRPRAADLAPARYTPTPKERWRVSGDGAATVYPRRMGRAGAIDATMLRFPDARAELEVDGSTAVVAASGPATAWGPTSTTVPAARAAERFAAGIEQRAGAGDSRAAVEMWLVEARASAATKAEARAVSVARGVDPWREPAGGRMVAVTGPLRRRPGGLGAMARDAMEMTSGWDSSRFDPHRARLRRGAVEVPSHSEAPGARIGVSVSSPSGERADSWVGPSAMDDAIWVAPGTGRSATEAHSRPGPSPARVPEASARKAAECIASESSIGRSPETRADGTVAPSRSASPTKGGAASAIPRSGSSRKAEDTGSRGLERTPAVGIRDVESSASRAREVGRGAAKEMPATTSIAAGSMPSGAATSAAAGSPAHRSTAGAVTSSGSPLPTARTAEPDRPAIGLGSRSSERRIDGAGHEAGEGSHASGSRAGAARGAAAEIGDTVGLAPPSVAESTAIEPQGGIRARADNGAMERVSSAPGGHVVGAARAVGTDADRSRASLERSMLRGLGLTSDEPIASFGDPRMSAGSVLVAPWTRSHRGGAWPAASFARGPTLVEPVALGPRPIVEASWPSEAAGLRAADRALGAAAEVQRALAAVFRPWWFDSPLETYVVPGPAAVRAAAASFRDQWSPFVAAPTVAESREPSPRSASTTLPIRAVASDRSTAVPGPGAFSARIVGHFAVAVPEAAWWSFVGGAGDVAGAVVIAAPLSESIGPLPAGVPSTSAAAIGLPPARVSATASVGAPATRDRSAAEPTITSRRFAPEMSRSDSTTASAPAAATRGGLGHSAIGRRRGDRAARPAAISLAVGGAWAQWRADRILAWTGGAPFATSVSAAAVRRAMAQVIETGVSPSLAAALLAGDSSAGGAADAVLAARSSRRLGFAPLMRAAGAPATLGRSSTTRAAGATGTIRDRGGVRSAGDEVQGALVVAAPLTRDGTSRHRADGSPSTTASPAPGWSLPALRGRRPTATFTDRSALPTDVRIDSGVGSVVVWSPASLRRAEAAVSPVVGRSTGAGAAAVAGPVGADGWRADDVPSAIASSGLSGRFGESAARFAAMVGRDASVSGRSQGLAGATADEVRVDAPGTLVVPMVPGGARSVAETLPAGASSSSSGAEHRLLESRRSNTDGRTDAPANDSRDAIAPEADRGRFARELSQWSTSWFGVSMPALAAAWRGASAPSAIRGIPLGALWPVEADNGLPTPVGAARRSTRLRDWAAWISDGHDTLGGPTGAVRDYDLAPSYAWVNPTVDSPAVETKSSEPIVAARRSSPRSAKLRRRPALASARAAVGTAARAMARTAWSGANEPAGRGWLLSLLRAALAKGQAPRPTIGSGQFAGAALRARPNIPTMSTAPSAATLPPTAASADPAWAVFDGELLAVAARDGSSSRRPGIALGATAEALATARMSALGMIEAPDEPSAGAVTIDALSEIFAVPSLRAGAAAERLGERAVAGESSPSGHDTAPLVGRIGGGSLPAAQSRGRGHVPTALAAAYVHGSAAASVRSTASGGSIDGAIRGPARIPRRRKSPVAALIARHVGPKSLGGGSNTPWTASVRPTAARGDRFTGTAGRALESAARAARPRLRDGFEPADAAFFTADAGRRGPSRSAYGAVNVDRALAVFERARVSAGGDVAGWREMVSPAPLPVQVPKRRSDVGELVNPRLDADAGSRPGWVSDGGVTSTPRRWQGRVRPSDRLAGRLFGGRGPRIAVSEARGADDAPALVETGGAAMGALKSTPGGRPQQKKETTEEARHRVAKEQIDENLSPEHEEQIAREVIQRLLRAQEFDLARIGEEEWD